MRYTPSIFGIHPHSIGVAVVALVAMYPVVNNDLVNYDDPIYAGSSQIVNGLTWKGIVWAFTGSAGGHWHPLTWLSLQLDCTLNDPDPYNFHFVNWLLHALNAVLLEGLLRRLGLSPLRALAVALLFAVHPLRVEPVAWVTERKELLAALFGLLALRVYLVYAERPSIGRYLGVYALLCATLLSKAMLVTLPCLLLVLDLLLLRRSLGWRWLVAEKLPMLLPVVFVSVMAVVAQAETGAVRSLALFPMDVRLSNAVMSYAKYIEQTFWPIDLAVYYPHPQAHPPLARFVLAASLLTLVSLWAVRRGRQQPLALVGWLWYLGTLVPVIGLVQVGRHAHADHFTYFPHIGLLVMLAVAWPVGWRRAGLWMLGVAVLLGVAVSWWQIGHWQNSQTLWRRAIAVTGGSVPAFLNYGVVAPSSEEAIAHFEAALRIYPYLPEAHANMALVYARDGFHERAYEEATKAVEMQPAQYRWRFIRGLVLKLAGKREDAEREFEIALEMKRRS